VKSGQSLHFFGDGKLKPPTQTQTIDALGVLVIGGA